MEYFLMTLIFFNGFVLKRYTTFEPHLMSKFTVKFFEHLCTQYTARMTAMRFRLSNENQRIDQLNYTNR